MSERQGQGRHWAGGCDVFVGVPAGGEPARNCHRPASPHSRCCVDRRRFRRAQRTAAPPQTPATPPAAAQAAPPDPLKFDTPAARVVILTCTDDAGQAMADALAKAKDVLAQERQA